ncbi:helix-turn-helix domain-containing protein [Pelomonas sp. KK5]|uniref:helix-turn-helix domain-containing protein n=1 Tax=Pelomonas sp. KK5 TaxID=1855730 RepID=UPI00097BF660|nr:XRE family transcriptional regulator [Pelomonas sp. KK5]
MSANDRLPGVNAESPGQAIRALRLDKRMTLAQVSAKTGLAISTLSKLEKGQVSLSFDKLTLLSKGLGVDIASLLEPQLHSPPPRTALGSGRRAVQHAGDGQLIETSSYRQLYLATELLNKAMTPIAVEIRARTLAEFTEEFGGLIRHSGEEFSLVLEGELEFHSELYAPLRLKEGDSVYFDSDMGHAYLNAGDTRCRVICVCAPRGDDAMTDLFVSASERLGAAAEIDAPTAPRSRLAVKRGLR